MHVIAGAAWTQGAAGMTKVARFTGKVLDQSLGGYRMAWASAEQPRRRVGELVGLNFGDEGEDQEWMVGVMRWLRYEDDGSLSAGVELLSRRASAVALRVVSADGGSRQLQPRGRDLPDRRHPRPLLRLQRQHDIREPHRSDVATTPPAISPRSPRPGRPAARDRGAAQRRRLRAAGRTQDAATGAVA